MGALKRRGSDVRGFKIGPDFIDPSYHTVATGSPSRNLDTWLLSDEQVVSLFSRAMATAEIAVIEGVMGLFDGSSDTGNEGSTAHIARLLHAPIVLVLDVWGMGRSAATIVEGCRRLLRGTHIGGVVLNKVAGEGHASICRKTIEAQCKVKVIGALPKDASISFEERHLGLIPTQESETVSRRIDKIVDFITSHIDLDQIVGIARNAPPFTRRVDTYERRPAPRKSIRVALAQDAAFNFYYHDSLEALRSKGVDLIPFSPIHDRELPDKTYGIYIGGGFPEVFGEQLQSNSNMRTQIAKIAEDGCPIIGECGGLMYLTKSITDFTGRTFRMVGLFDAFTRMVNQLTLSYTEAELLCNSPLGHQGQRIRGHEYHFSTLEDIPGDARFAYLMLKGSGIANRYDGWINHQTIGQYTHLHFAGAPKATSRFVDTCRAYARK